MSIQYVEPDAMINRLNHELTELEAKLAEANKWVNAIDEALVCAHLGTTHSFASPKEAVNAFGHWSKGVGEYFAKERVAELETQLKAANARTRDTCAENAQLREAATALGVMPDGICFCSKNRCDRRARSVCTACRDLRAALGCE